MAYVSVQLSQPAARGRRGAVELFRNAGADSASLHEFDACGIAIGRDEFNHNIEDFCGEYAGMPHGNELSCPETSGRKLYMVIAILPDPDRTAGQEFAALLYFGYIRVLLIQIRDRIVTVVITYVLLLWALTSYPWMNRHAILISLCLLLALISAAALNIYSAMHRDDILSHTTETEPGNLDPEFFGKVIPTIDIPLMTLVATQFPALSNFICSWVEPCWKGP